MLFQSIHSGKSIDIGRNHLKFVTIEQRLLKLHVYTNVLPVGMTMEVSLMMDMMTDRGNIINLSVRL